jgi:hypothetical protein
MSHRTLLSLFVFVLPTTVTAHHAFNATYDPGVITELEGEVASVLWANPHIRITLNVPDESGATREWQLEGNAKNQLERMLVSNDLIAAGDTVRVAGNPSRRGSDQLYLGQILLADGQEVLLRGGFEPRWSPQVIGDARGLIGDGTPADEAARARGIFRVWSTSTANRATFPIWQRNYPLTESAIEVQSDWDPQSTILTCTSFGMPTVMNSPDPIEFIDQGDSILLRLESFDIERTIHIYDIDESPVNEPLGYSIGHWDEGSLRVNTRHIDWPHFDQLGIPQSDAVELEEKFTVTPDGSRLQYSLVVTDPATFTEPVVLEKYWFWRESEVVKPYDGVCDP